MTRFSIKSRPEDFVVREVASLSLRARGAYSVWLLTKSGWNTSELIDELSQGLKRPLSDFAYGGRKDRHALTSQYITIKGRRPPALKTEAYSLEFVGYMERPMGPDLIEKNAFVITMRKLDGAGIKRACSEIEVIQRTGYPNYFDDQRFGSFDGRQGFFAQKLLKQEYNGALKIYLSAIYAQDRTDEKRRKTFFFEHWRDWRTCLVRASTGVEKRILKFLCQHPTGFLPLLKTIPRGDLSIYFSAYQAHLWNEVLRRLVRANFSAPLKRYSGVAGDYLFYTAFSREQQGWLSDLSIPTAGAGAKMPTAALQELYTQVLADDGIRTALFGKIKIRAAYCKTFARRALVVPGHISCDVRDDDAHAGSKKLVLTFDLPRGSYATMLLKRIMSSPL
jgi:tRNA pseudouridine13 synthase